MRLMFVSPHCLLDRSSGAALSVIRQLELLHNHGWSCCSLTGAVLDPAWRVDLKRALEPWGGNPKGVFGTLPLWGGCCNGVEHTVLLFSDSRRACVTAYDEFLLYRLVQHQLEAWQPDIVYCYGGWALERSLLRLARVKRITTCFMLTNNNYDDPDAFADVDAVFTPTQTLSDQYRERLGLPAVNIGEFVDTSLTSVERENPCYVTFINPSPEKGVALFVALVRQALTHLPQLRFLVVQSRWTREMVAECLGVDWALLPNVDFLPQQQDMRAVYVKTRILLFPSFCFEASGRVLQEAQANGIPVLASNHGGITEMLSGGGFQFVIPERCRQNYSELPQADEVEPWLRCLERLCNDRCLLGDAEKRAQRAAQRHDLNRLAKDMDGLLRDIVVRSAKS